MVGICFLQACISSSCSENYKLLVPNLTSEFHSNSSMCSLSWTKPRKWAGVAPHSKEPNLVTPAVWGLISSRPMEIGHMCDRWDLWGFWLLCGICFWKCFCCSDSFEQVSQLWHRLWRLPVRSSQVHLVLEKEIWELVDIQHTEAFLALWLFIVSLHRQAGP